MGLAYKACADASDGYPRRITYVIGAEGQSLAAESAGSAPISEALFTEAQAAIDAIK